MAANFICSWCQWQKKSKIHQPSWQLQQFAFSMAHDFPPFWFKGKCHVTCRMRHHMMHCILRSMYLCLKDVGISRDDFTDCILTYQLPIDNFCWKLLLYVHTAGTTFTSSLTTQTGTLGVCEDDYLWFEGTYDNKPFEGDVLCLICKIELWNNYSTVKPLKTVQLVPDLL